MSKNLNYSVAGVVRNYADSEPLPGLRIRAYDKDFFRDQFLGEAKTDANGQYDIRFSREEFTGLLRLERHPDIFVQVFNDHDELIYTTENSVVVDAGKHTTLDITLRIHPAKKKRITHINGMAVDMKYVPKLQPEDLVNAYKLVRRPDLKVKNIELIKKAFPDLFHHHHAGDDCGEARTLAIRLLLKERNAEQLLVDADDFEGGVTIKTFFTTNILVKYTVDAASASRLTGGFATVPVADSAFALPDGTPLGTIRFQLANLHADNTEVAPSYVQKIGLIAEYALTQFISPAYNFRDPRNGAVRLEYRVLLQSAGTFGQTSPGWTHVEVGINNTDAQCFGTIPHEMFHQVQYRYNTNNYAAGGIRGIIIEGGARFIEDCIWDTPNRYAQSAAGIINAPGIFPSPQTSLTDPGGGTAIRYAGGLVWKYIAEHHSPNTLAANEPEVGVETFRIILEKTASDQAGFTIQGLRDARGAMPWYGTFDKFGYYDAGLTELNWHETTWGNYLIANYVHGLMMPGDPDYDQRFNYLEDEDTGAPLMLNAQKANVTAANQISLSQGSAVPRNVAGHAAFASVYYEIIPNSGSLPRMLQVSFSVTSGMADPIVQIIRFGPGDTLVDIHRSDKTNYSKTINMSGLAKVVVIVGSRDSGGNFTINFNEVASAQDVMVTRWNSRVGTEYEFDPKGWAWNWMSPDIIVDNDNNLLDDTAVYFDQNNKLKVRLRNRGNANANNMQIEFWYQKATPYLSSAAWSPVQNQLNVTQVLTGQSLAAGAEGWFTVDWCPDNDGSGHPHWCVKVLVTAPGDPNIDNKMAFRNFNNLQADPDHDMLSLIRTLEFRTADMLHIIPRTKAFNLEIVNPDSMRPLNKAAKVCDCDSQIVLKAPDELNFVQLRLKKTNLTTWDKKNTVAPNDAQMFYPTDPRSLPPGVESDELITIAHLVDNKVVGGVTYRVGKQER